MKYFVTFCYMDEDVDANFFGHACIVLSIKEEGADATEVVDVVGFYGLPTTAPDSWKRKLKMQLSLDVDLTDNHGMLCHEPMRRLDAGKGLHGVTFELTPENFNNLKSRCDLMILKQEEAIMECVALLNLERYKEKKFRVYPYEKHSQAIYHKELELAKARGVPPRLKPFEFKLTWGLGGPALNQSLTCKSQIINLLTGLLTPKQIDRLTQKGVHPTVPRLSGPMENVYLHSTGPFRTHTRSNGAVVSYRDWGEGVKLYWTIPPQELEALTVDTLEKTTLPQAYIGPIKVAVSQCQQLEWYFRNVALPAEAETARHELLKQLISAYQLFTTLPLSPEHKLVNGVSYRLYGFFNWPRSTREQWCAENLAKIYALFNTLMDAALDKTRDNLVISSLSFEERLAFSRILQREDQLLVNSEPLQI